MKGQSEQTVGAAGRLETSRVLLVDDDVRLAQALSDVLAIRLPGVRADACGSAREALERVTEVDYDVLVSDVLMPIVDGIELMERVHQRSPRCLTILVTGVDDRDLTLRALRSGAYDFIMKPVESDYFVASVGRALETRRLRREVERQQAALRSHAEELEQAVEQRTRELRDAHRVKDEFLATVSHELRTPLTSILGWARLLLSGKLDEETQSHAMESIARNAKSQSQLIDDLLDVSRIIAGKFRLDVQRVELSAVLDSALDVVLPAAQAKRILIEPAIEGSVGEIAGDAERLQQVFWNLLSNAVKFTPEGGRVTIRGARADSHVEIAIADTGTGIPAELLPHVFERFRQAESGAHGSRRGLGLGLAIVRHIVELHGGVVGAASDGEGRGAEFVVRLPAGPIERRLAAASPRATLSNREAELRLAGTRVLVVDDEADTRRVLALTLEHAGAVVETVGSAAEAFAAIRRDPPHVLLCDIGLPDEDGYALIARVRALAPERASRVPAVALTAFAKPEDRKRALEAGFQVHMPKPGPSDLAAVVASLIDVDVDV